MRKRTLSLVICLVMAFSLLLPGLSALAAGGELVKSIDVNTVVEGDGQKVKTIVYHLSSAEGLEGLKAEDFTFTGSSYAWASKYVGDDPYSPAAYRTEEAEAFEAEIAEVALDAEAKTLTVTVAAFPPKYYYVAEYTVACAANEGLTFSNKSAVKDDMTFESSNGKVKVHTAYAEAFEYVEASEDLSYYLYTPQGAGEKALPLVLSNHGSGDHMTLLANRVSLSFAEPGVQDKNPSYVLAPVYPQQPHNAEDPDGAAENQAEMQDKVIEQTIAAIEDMVKKGLVDPDRIYVSGKSMGGGNTVRIAIQYPELFAAALPLCPGGRADGMDITAIKDMPVWFLVGEFDGLAPNSKEMHQALVDAGSYKAKITVYSPEIMYARGIAKHHDVEIIALEDARYFDWLYAQKKPKGKVDYVRVNTETAPRGHTITSIDIYTANNKDASALGKGAFAQKLTGQTYNWASSKSGGVYRSASTVPFEARVKNVLVTGNKVTITFDPMMGYVQNNPENGVDSSFAGYKKYFYVKDFQFKCLEDPAFTITKADVNDTTALVADGFAQQSESLGADLEYNLYAPTGTITPKVEAAEGQAEVPEKREAMPLVVVLHGSGDQGNLYANRMAVAWAEDKNMAERPAYILAPVYTNQATTDSLNATTAKVAAMIEGLIEEGLVDPNRVTVMGKSMGGKNTQRMYKDYPDLLAAAMPISGGLPQEFMDADGLPARELVTSFAGRPLYIVHSEGDSSTKQSENLYAAIKKEDPSKVLFKEYTAEEFKKLNVKPHDVEIVSMEDPQFMEWLYSQSKNGLASGAETVKEENKEDAAAKASPAKAEAAPAKEEPASNGYPQSIGTPSILNSRDLGGYNTTDGRTVVSGKLLRTGMLKNATPEDIATLENKYKVTAIIDLREPEDNKTDPDPAIKGAKYYNIPSVTMVKWLTDDYYKESQDPKVYTADRKFENPYLQYVQSKDYDIAGYFASAYAANALDKRSQQAYYDAFQIILDNKDGATIFHCSHGKDRTGTLAAMLLYVLGVDRETIMEDYLLTNMYQAESSDEIVAWVSEETDDPYLQHQVRLTNDIDPLYLEAFFDGCEQVYGDFDTFIAEGIGLTQDDIQALRDMYTE